MDINNKLSSVLNNKMQKLASLGNFKSKDLKDPEARRKKLELPSKLLELDKYQTVVNQLKNADGIVQFVTHNEFPPLVELILKAAFPTESNDIFTGTTFSTKEIGAGNNRNRIYDDIKPIGNLGDEYYLGNEYWGRIKDTIKGPTPAHLTAKERLEFALLGQDLVCTRSYLRNTLGMTKQHIDALLGPALSERGESDPDPYPVGTAADKYEEGLRQIAERYDPVIATFNESILTNSRQLRRAKSALRSSIDQIETLSEAIAKKKGKDVAAEHERIALLQKNNEELNNQIRGLENAIEADSARKLEFVGAKKTYVETLFNMYGKLATRQIVLGGQPKLNSGLIGFFAQDDMIATYRMLSKQLKDSRENMPSDPEEAKKLSNTIMATADSLKKQLEEMPFDSDELQESVSSVIDMLKDKTYAGFMNLRGKGLGTFHDKFKPILKASESKGSIMILDDFDTSVLCNTKDRDKDKRITLDDGVQEILGRYKKANDRLREQYKAKTPDQQVKKPTTLILVTSEAIGDVASDHIIEFLNIPVQDDEARILVDYFLKDYTTEAKKAAFRQLEIEIEDMEIDSAEVKQYREEQKAIIHATAGRVMDLTRQRLISGIRGAKLNMAIETLRTSIKECTTKKKDSWEVTLDEQRLASKVASSLNRNTHRRGITFVKPNVKMADYAYEPLTLWAQKIATIHASHKILYDIRMEINSTVKKINDLKEQISENKALPLGDENKWSKETMQEKVTILNDYYLHLTNQNNELKIAASDIPHGYLLYGDPGVGKSVWADALADLLGIETIASVDIGRQFSSLVGSTQENTAELLNTLRYQKDTVFLFDEIDRQGLTQSGGEGGVIGHNELMEQVMTQLLDFLERDTPRLIENNSYIICTTNYLERLDDALLSRLQNMGQYEVVTPTDPEAYKKFFIGMVHTERSKFPEKPWIRLSHEETIQKLKELDPESDFSEFEKDSAIDKMNWEETERIVLGLNWDKIAKAYAGKKIGFRTLKSIITKAFEQDKLYRQQIKMIERGEAKYPTCGLPLTEENLIYAATLVKFDKESKEVWLGIEDYALYVNAQIAKIMAPYVQNKKKFETEPNIDPVTGEIDLAKPTKIKIPEELKAFYNGTTPKQRERVDAIIAQSEQQIEILRQEREQRWREKMQAVAPDQEEFTSQDGAGEGAPEGGQEQEEPGYQFTQETLPSGQKRRELVPTPKSKMSLEDIEKQINQSPFGLQEAPLTEDKGKSKKTDKGKSKDKKKDTTEGDDNIESSTDYYYGFLKKNGLLDKMAQVATPQTAQSTQPTQPTQPAQNPQYKEEYTLNEDGLPVEYVKSAPDSGCYNLGYLIIAPKTVQTPPHIYKNVKGN